MSWEKKTRCLWLLDKLKRENTLTLEEYECLSSVRALELIYYAAEHAGEVRKEVYGNEVYIRGLIKISNNAIMIAIIAACAVPTKIAIDTSFRESRFLPAV